jgi:hypothetical protein
VLFLQVTAWNPVTKTQGFCGQQTTAIWEKYFPTIPFSESHNSLPSNREEKIWVRISFLFPLRHEKLKHKAWELLPN